METVEALVLRTVEFSESSLVVTLLSRECGKIEALAKGARRLKNPFETSLDLLARIRVCFLRKRGDALDLLTEAKLVHRFRPRSNNVAGLYAAYYWLELLDALTETYDVQPGLYDLAVATLQRLEAGTKVVRTLLRAEWYLLRQIGQQPVLDRCVECDRPVAVGSREENGEGTPVASRRYAFALADGGLLCPRCRQGHAQVVNISAAALETLKTLVRPREKVAAANESPGSPVTQEPWERVPMERETLNELRGLMNRYYTHLLGRRPRLYDALALVAANDTAAEEAEDDGNA